MSAQKAPDVRGTVLDLLLHSPDFPTRAFAEAMQRAGFDGRDRGLARQLLSGVQRHSFLLDAIARPYCRRRISDDSVRWAIRLGVFQLYFLSSVPEHAAIHATIQAARPHLRDKTGFVHAVLRAVQRGAKLEEPYSEEFSRRRLTRGRRSWFFSEAIFDRPDLKPIEYWSTMLSFPPTLVRKWFGEIGEEAALRRMHALNELPVIWVRVNTRRASREAVVAALREAQADVEEAEHERFIILNKPGRELSALPGFAEGHWAVQDLSSFAAIELAGVRAGERVLDLCAAPGGKSMALCELTDGGAEVLACDVDANRLARIAPEAARLGHEIECMHFDGDAGELPAGQFDWIVLDVPCSNTGVFNKRLEARHRFDKDSLHRATTTQNILRKRVQNQYCSPGLPNRPRVVWATCSLEPEENQEMAARFAKQAQYRIVREQLFEPDGQRSGGFAAILEPVE